MTVIDSETTVAERVDVGRERPAMFGRAWLHERAERRVAGTVAIAWFLLMQVAMLLEPRTAEPVPVFGVVLEIVSYTLLGLMAAGLIMRRRWGFVASLAGAVVATGAAVACPISGHHSYGAWWFAQMACVLALVGVSVVALRTAPAEA